MFVNFSNHPYETWSDKQKEAARQFGLIEDLPFPNVDPTLKTVEIREMAYDYYGKILRMQPDYVLCQGEFCLAFNVVNLLREHGIRVGAACSVRKTIDLYEDGVSKRVSVFEFEQFRDY